MSTVRDLITSALISADAVGIEEIPDGSAIVRGLRKLNHIVQALALDNLWNYTFSTITFTSVVGQGDYTIGDGTNPVDIIANTPQELASININRNDVWAPLELLSEMEFDSKVRLSNNNTGIPRYAIYRREHPDGVIVLYPTPAETNNIRIRTRDMVTEFALDDVVNLPPGYEGYLETALAAQLAIDYGTPFDTLQALATSRLATIKRQNFQPLKLRLPTFDTNSGQYDINTDTFYGGY